MTTQDKGYALVTGASQGIGAAIALELARHGFGVVVAARSAGALQQVSTQAGAINGGRAHAVVVDLLAADGVDHLVRSVHELGLPLTCLANNAGHAHWGLFGEVPLEDHQKLMHLNMSVPIALTHALLPLLKRQKRAYILNTGSMAAYHALASMSLYSGSKAFLLRWGRSLRIELESTGITVTTVCPGSVITGFTARAGMQAMDDLARKFGTPPEPVAKAAVSAMLRGNAEVVPGLLNKITVALQAIVPMNLTERTASNIYLKRLRKKPGA